MTNTTFILQMPSRNLVSSWKKTIYMIMLNFPKTKKQMPASRSKMKQQKLSVASQAVASEAV
jgi:hypothetical protein